MTEETKINCPICERETPEKYQEEHHLIPRSISKRNKYKKLDTKETLTVCISCGDQLHKLFTHKELADECNTLDAILGSPKIQKWIAWISKKPEDFSISMRTKKGR